MSEKKYRNALSQFRLSSHDLEIERSRYANVNRDDRICLFCNSNKIENEYHNLLTCSFYMDLRKTYLKRYYYQWPTLNKFDNLMSTTNRTIVINLANMFTLPLDNENKILAISMFSNICLVLVRVRSN